MAPHNDYSGIGGLKIISAEMSELLYPIMIDHHEMRPILWVMVKQWEAQGIRIKVGPMILRWRTCRDGVEPTIWTVGGNARYWWRQFSRKPRDRSARFCSAKGYMEIKPGEAWVGVSSGGGGSVILLRGRPLQYVTTFETVSLAWKLQRMFMA